MTNIKWLSEIGKEDSSQTGAKASSIGELNRLKFNSPNGFVITTDVYENFIKEKKGRIMNILRGVDSDSEEDLKSAHDRISNLFMSSGIQKKIREEIEEAYNNLMVSNEAKEAGGKALEMIKAGREKPDVAVRSSVPKTNSSTSFAGIHENFLNVKGTDSLFDRIKKIWLSLFTPEAIFYREKNSIPHDLKMAVIVQRMGDMEKSGRALTFNPVNGKEEVIIESVEGSGKKLSIGNVIPNLLIFDKRTGEIKKKVDRNGNLNEKEIEKIFKCVKKIDENFPKAQEIEWGLKRGKLYLFQSKSLASNNNITREQRESEPLLEGIGVSSGNVRNEIVNFSSEIEDGKIAFTRKLFPELILKMNRIGGIVSENGGITSSISHIAREFDTPVLIAEEASSKIRMNEEVLMDSSNGKLYQRRGKSGSREVDMELEEGKEREFSPTATEIKLVSENMDQVPSEKNLDGIIIINENNGFEFGSYNYGMKSSIKDLSEDIYPNEIWLQTKSSGDRFSLIREMHHSGIDNIHVLFSSIKTKKDFSKVREEGKFNSLPSSVKRGILIETPAIALEIEDFCERGIDFVDIDLKSLTQYTTGGGEVSQSNSSVNDLIGKIVDCCNKYKVHSSIYIKSGNRNIVSKMVEIGVDSINTTEGYLNFISKEIERSERRMLLEKARRDK